MSQNLESKTPIHELESQSQWLAVASIVLGIFMVVVSEILPVGLLTDLSRHFMVSEGTVGWMITAPGIAATVTALVFSILIGKMDRRTIFCLLSFLMLLSNVLIIIAPNFTWVIFARLLSGVCVGGFWTFSFAAARGLVVPQLADRATAFILAAVSAAMVLAVPIGSYIGSSVGWQYAFITLAVLAALAFVIQWIYLPALPAQGTIQPVDMWNVLKTKQARLVLWFITVVITGHFAAQTYLKPLLEQKGVFSANQTTILLFVYGLAGFIGTYIAEKGVQKHLRWLLILSSVAMSGALVLTLVESASISVLAIIFWGVAYGIIPVGIQIWMYRSVPNLLESSSALIVVMFQVAIALGAWVGGIVVDEVSMQSTMVVGALLALLAAVFPAQLKH